MHHLLDVARGLVAELDPETILSRILASARDLTGARYAALGILDEQRGRLEHFLTIGIDEHTRAAIGTPPSGRGVLGALLDDPRPLRLSDVGRHPHSYGFPAGHPIMKSFLGVPIMIDGQTWGNLYLTDKTGGEFTETDEEAVMILAEWAATALENSRLYQASERRRLELEQTLRGLEATRDVMIAIGSDVELGRTLELIAKRARALVDARSLIVLLPEGSDIVVAASAGYADQRPGSRIPPETSTLWSVLESGVPLRIAEAAHGKLGLGLREANCALLVPLLYRRETLGVLLALDRGADRSAFTDDDERLLQAFADSAAAAYAIARSIHADTPFTTISGRSSASARV